MYESIKASWEKFTNGMDVLWTFVTRIGAWLSVEKMIMWMRGQRGPGPIGRMIKAVKNLFWRNRSSLENFYWYNEDFWS